MLNRKSLLSILCLVFLGAVNIPFFLELNNSAQFNLFGTVLFGLILIVNCALFYLMIGQLKKLNPNWQAFGIMFLAVWIALIFVYKPNLLISTDNLSNMIFNPLIWMLIVTSIFYSLLIYQNKLKNSN
jgi:hypothetical protein